MTIEKLIEGLQIIAKYQPEGEVSVGHDVFYAGDYNPDEMTDEDKATLEALGWGEEYDSWYHFV